MKLIRLPEERERRLVFYLAMEEYLARYTEGEAFFVWRVPPTVIIGRNQLMAAEVNLGYCREHGVQVYRRKSGGGCVYSDMGNLMISYVTSGDDVPFIFAGYMQRLALCLRRMGAEAEISGRNDILVGGRKVSGNAFYSLHGRNIIHGTLLFNSSTADLERAITPSESKLRSKGVASARQRVANLRDIFLTSDRGRRYADIGLFIQTLISGFCDEGETVLDREAVDVIAEIERTYLDPDFLYGHEPSGSLSESVSLPESGTLSVSVGLKGGRIRAVSLRGDYLQLKDGLEPALEKRLVGVSAREEEVSAALAGFDPGRFVRGLDVGTLVRLLTGRDANGSSAAAGPAAADSAAGPDAPDYQ